MITPLGSLGSTQVIEMEVELIGRTCGAERLAGTATKTN